MHFLTTEHIFIYIYILIFTCNSSFWAMRILHLQTGEKQSGGVWSGGCIQNLKKKNHLVPLLPPNLLTWKAMSVGTRRWHRCFSVRVKNWIKAQPSFRASPTLFPLSFPAVYLILKDGKNAKVSGLHHFPLIVDMGSEWRKLGEEQ